MHHQAMWKTTNYTYNEYNELSKKSGSYFLQALTYHKKKYCNARTKLWFCCTCSVWSSTLSETNFPVCIKEQNTLISSQHNQMKLAFEFVAVNNSTHSRINTSIVVRLRSHCPNFKLGSLVFLNQNMHWNLDRPISILQPSMCWLRECVDCSP